jgi:hypothetical protein
VYDTVHTALFYDDFPVTAVADWTQVGVPFSATCSIDFEKATLIYDSTAVTVYPKDNSGPVTLPPESVSGYQSEISYFCDVIEGVMDNVKNPAISAATTLKLIEHIRQSADAKGKIVSFSANK